MIFLKSILHSNEELLVISCTDLSFFTYCYLDPINTFHSSYKTDNEPIRISYHRNVHYNSVVDPYKATIGVGLGLPGLQPGASIHFDFQFCLYLLTLSSLIF